MCTNLREEEKEMSLAIFSAVVILGGVTVYGVGRAGKTITKMIKR